MRHTLRSLLVLALLVGCVDSDKVSWVIISNPSGSFPGTQGGLIVTWRYSDQDTSFVFVLTASGTGAAATGKERGGFRIVETGGATGNDPTRSREILVGLDTDAVVLSEDDRTEIVSPALPGGSIVIEGKVALQTETDTATLVRVVGPSDTFHIAAAGNLVLRENRSGVTVYYPGRFPGSFSEGTRVEAARTDYVLRETWGGSTLLHPPPTIGVGSQARYDAGRGSYRFYAVDGSFTAELPASPFATPAAETGLVLDGEFGAGTVGSVEGAFRAVLTRRNHHLILLR